MTHEAKGAYMDLLVFQFNNGNFTEQQAKQVLSICFASVWEVMKNKFKTEGENGEFLYNERLRNEINKRKAFSESRKINALHEKRPRKAYAKHMGNENENENIDIIKDKKEKYSADFLSFYNAYPKHKKRDDAFKAWKSLNGTRPELSVLLAAIEDQKKSEEWLKENGQFIPYPASWLRAGSWADEVNTNNGQPEHSKEWWDNRQKELEAQWEAEENANS